MPDKINIAIDAMGGENSPAKIIEGINLSLLKNKENFFFLFGKQNLIEKEVKKYKLVQEHSKIINVDTLVLDDESPLSGAKKGNKTSMWKAIESQKDGVSDIALSAGNTGALLVISRLILSTIEGISKPALAALWPNENNMSVVLDLGANIECDEKNLSDFATLGSALFKSLFNDSLPKVALLNVGLEENKGKEVLKKAYSILKER